MSGTTTLPLDPSDMSYGELMAMFWRLEAETHQKGAIESLQRANAALEKSLAWEKSAEEARKVDERAAATLSMLCSSPPRRSARAKRVAEPVSVPTWAEAMRNVDVVEYVTPLFKDKTEAADMVKKGDLTYAVFARRFEDEKVYTGVVMVYKKMTDEYYVAFEDQWELYPRDVVEMWLEAESGIGRKRPRSV